ncbi:hypothetical protein GCM10017687_24720 [Streptomyces echinatus]
MATTAQDGPFRQLDEQRHLTRQPSERKVEQTGLAGASGNIWNQLFPPPPSTLPGT